MSLQPTPIAPVPDDTARIARAAFPKGNPYLRLRDDLGLFYTDEQFAPLFSWRGQPAETPWRLALVLVLQFAENLTDRQAADAVRGRLDWKYLLLRHEAVCVAVDPRGKEDFEESTGCSAT
jgi:transposase